MMDDEIKEKDSKESKERIRKWRGKENKNKSDGYSNMRELVGVFVIFFVFFFYYYFSLMLGSMSGKGFVGRVSRATLEGLHE